jgi:hypothetical protein
MSQSKNFDRGKNFSFFQGRGVTIFYTDSRASVAAARQITSRSCMSNYLKPLLEHTDMSFFRHMGSAFLAGLGGTIAYKAYQSYGLVDKMNGAGVRDMVLLKDIEDRKLDICIGSGYEKHKSDQNVLKDRRATIITNLLEASQRSDHEHTFNHCINLLLYYQKPIDPNTVSGDVFLILPHYYLDHLDRKGVFVSKNLTKEAETASYLNIYTRDICLAYLIRNGHYIQWLQQIVRQEFFSILVAGGVSFAVARASSAARAATRPSSNKN